MMQRGSREESARQGELHLWRPQEQRNEAEEWTEAGEGGRSLWSMMKILVLNVESSKNPLSGF